MSCLLAAFLAAPMILILLSEALMIADLLILAQESFRLDRVHAMALGESCCCIKMAVPLCGTAFFVIFLGDVVRNT